MSNITATPQKPSSVDVNKMTFSSVKSLPSGAKIIYLNYEGNSLFVQSPEMTVPYDSGTFYADEKNPGSGKYNIKVSMDGFNEDGQMKKFHDMLLNMDKKIMESGIVNSLAWFKKKSLSEDIAKELYNSMVKVSLDSETGEPNGKWAPTFAFKIVKRDGKVLCDCYDSDKKELVLEGDGSVDLETMFKKGTKVKMILKCNGLWIASGKFGCTWRAEQVKVNSPIEYSGYAFDDDDDEEDSKEVRSEPVEQTDNFVESEEESEDSKDEEEVKEDSESESEEEEEQPLVKKVVKKKKKASN
uniref:Uncharacterized protein n=1 Tax=viral metagenome TaxID=1070528 RepID=A0A6C0CE70_9ZZZZ